uniref:KA1 domain-containing protein n=1 Tax=Lotharella oceanica TaxID=641309 RepID=A0A7S2TQE3_9EUKA
MDSFGSYDTKSKNGKPNKPFGNPRRESYLSGNQTGMREDRKTPLSGISSGGIEAPSLTRSAFPLGMPVLHAQRGGLGGSSKPVFRSMPDVAGAELEGDAYRSAFDVTVVSPRPLPPVIEEHTSFTCNRPAIEIYRAIESALMRYDVDANPSKAKFKGSGKVMGEQIRFQVHIFAMERGKGHVVEIQRRFGDSCSFWHMFTEVMNHLAMDLADAAAFVKENHLEQSKMSSNVWSDEQSRKLDQLVKSLSLAMLADRPTPAESGLMVH